MYLKKKLKCKFDFNQFKTVLKHINNNISQAISAETNQKYLNPKSQAIKSGFKFLNPDLTWI